MWSRDIGKFRNLALALLVWMYVKQQGADSKPAAPSLELRTTLNLTHGRHLPLASKIGWRYCPPLSLQCTGLGWLYSALYPTGTSYYILLLLRTSNVKQNEDWQHKFTRRIVRHCWREEKVTHYHILYVPFFWNYIHIPNFYMSSLAQGKSKYQLWSNPQI